METGGGIPGKQRAALKKAAVRFKSRESFLAFPFSQVKEEDYKPNVSIDHMKRNQLQPVNFKK